MSAIRPLRAIRYATRPGKADLSAKLAPPYDVLDEAGKQRLLNGDPDNFVGVDLPVVPAKAAGPAAVYAAAAARLQGWLDSRVMLREQAPALYVYHQTYTHAGVRYVRKKFFARLRAEPFGTGSVFPHERTFGGPKEDRLALTKATEANLSPIFGLYEDGANEVSRMLEAALPGEPVATGTLEGVAGALWAVTDKAVIERCTKLLAPRPIYIADGHHRYGTALLYRDWLVQEQGPLPDEHPANYVLCVFCAMEDPGLLILPTHRVLSQNVAAVFARPEVASQVQCTPLDVAGGDAAVQALSRFGPQAVALFDGTRGRYLAVQPKAVALLDSLEPSHSLAWRRLALAFLHAYLIDRVVRPQLCGGEEPKIQYIKDAGEAVSTAQAARGSAFLMQATTMKELRDVCSAGDLMPQKSTFFYPKLASGLVVNPLSE